LYISYLANKIVVVVVTTKFMAPVSGACVVAHGTRSRNRCQ